MNRALWLSLAFGLAGSGLLRAQAPAAEPPTDWIDPSTGHRIVRLSREAGTESLYFTQNAYTHDGKLIVTTPHGLATIDLATGAIDRGLGGTGTAQGRKALHLIQTGRKTGAIFYVEAGSAYALDPATGASRKVADLPGGEGTVSLDTVNADETLLAGTITVGSVPAVPPSAGPPPPADPPLPPSGNRALGHDNYPGKGDMMERRLAAHLPMILFTLDLRTGVRTDQLRSTDWLNHLQFSPTDPTLLMFCHEGPWHKVDRIWTLRTDGKSVPTLVHQRTMKMEIAGHEFWGADGQWIWYDLQTPRGEVFWLAGYNVTTGQRRWYHVDRDQWSVHYNVSPDGTLFAGDGGSLSKSVAHAANGQWIYLFRPKLMTDAQSLGTSPPLIQAGTFQWERLVNLSQHDYSLEPNVTFTPDMKWLVFRSNMSGTIQVYAVEIAKARAKPAPPPTHPPTPSPS